MNELLKRLIPLHILSHVAKLSSCLTKFLSCRVPSGPLVGCHTGPGISASRHMADTGGPLGVTHQQHFSIYKCRCACLLSVHLIIDAVL